MFNEPASRTELGLITFEIFSERLAIVTYPFGTFMFKTLCPLTKVTVQLVPESPVTVQGRVDDVPTERDDGKRSTMRPFEGNGVCGVKEMVYVVFELIVKFDAETLTELIEPGVVV
jgi:hypothetical protein